MIVCLRVTGLPFSETLRQLNMECKRLLTKPPVFDSALFISDPSVLTSLMRNSTRTEFKSI